MLSKLFLLILLLNCLNLNSYILKLADFDNKQERFFDVGAKDRITGNEIRTLLATELRVPYERLIVFRPEDYEPQSKDRTMKSTDVFHTIDQTSKAPILFRIK